MLLRVKSRLHGTLKNFQGKYLYGGGGCFETCTFFASLSLIYGISEKGMFDFTDFINVLMPDVG